MKASEGIRGAPTDIPCASCRGNPYLPFIPSVFCAAPGKRLDWAASARQRPAPCPLRFYEAPVLWGMPLRRSVGRAYAGVGERTAAHVRLITHFRIPNQDSCSGSRPSATDRDPRSRLYVRHGRENASQCGTTPSRRRQWDFRGHLLLHAAAVQGAHVQSLDEHRCTSGAGRASSWPPPSGSLSAAPHRTSSLVVVTLSIAQRSFSAPPPRAQADAF